MITPNKEELFYKIKETIRTRSSPKTTPTMWGICQRCPVK